MTISEVSRDLLSLIVFYIRCFLRGGKRYPLASQKKSKPISILGNGPSLQKYLDEKQNSFDALCVNFSPLTDEFYLIKPSFLTLIDPAFFDITNEEVKKLIQTITDKVDWNITIVVSSIYSQKAKELYGKSNVNIVVLPAVCYDPKSRSGYKWRNTLFQKGWCMPSAQNVAIAAIYFAINSGYKDIRLYGLDHSWMKDTYVSEDNMVCLEDKHYYGTQHVAWGYNKDGSAYTMHQVMYCLYLMFKGYYELKEYIEYLGDVHIINKSKTSWIDAFDREQ